MKKLTAGIFATILGLTAVDAFAAVPSGHYNVASVKYVNEAMEAAKSAATYDDSAVTGRLDAIETEQTQQNTNITNAANAAAAADAKAAAAQTAAEAADAKAVANTNLIGAVEEGKTVVQMIEEAEAAASYDDTEVRGLITTAQTQADKGVADAATAQAAAEAADAKAVAAQNEVDALEINVSTNYVAWADVDETYTPGEYTFTE